MGKRLNTHPYTDLPSKQERTRWILLQNGKLSYEKEHQIYLPYASSWRPESTLKRSSDDIDSNDINVSLAHGENSRRGRLKTGAVHEALKASAILKILKRNDTYNAVAKICLTSFTHPGISAKSTLTFWTSYSIDGSSIKQFLLFTNKTVQTSASKYSKVPQLHFQNVSIDIFQNNFIKVRLNFYQTHVNYPLFTIK